MSSASKILVSNLFHGTSKISVEVEVDRSPKTKPYFALEPLFGSFAAGYHSSSSSVVHIALRLLKPYSFRISAQPLAASCHFALSDLAYWHFTGVITSFKTKSSFFLHFRSLELHSFCL